MKNGLLAVAVLSAAALTWGCSNNQPAPIATETPVAETTYSSLKLKVTASEEWVSNNSPIPTYMKSASSYTITVDTLPDSSMTPDAYVDFAKGEYKKVFDDAAFTPVTNLTVSGKEARRYGFTGSTSGITMKFVILYVFDGGKAHTLTCGSPDFEFAANEADIENMISTAVLE